MVEHSRRSLELLCLFVTDKLTNIKHMCNNTYMEYNKKTSKKILLSNVELSLLSIIIEKKEVSGYEINKLIEQRGYREWADIGGTSIYNGLEKLYKKGLVFFEVYEDKNGKGPIPKIFKITKDGEKRFKTEIIDALSSTRERDKRFDIALASVSYLGRKEVIKALSNRKSFLMKEKERLNSLFEKQGGNNMPVQAKFLFRHPIILIDSETSFIDEIIKSLKERKR